jgi:putative hydrolase of the HAD superfamily
VNDAAPRGIAFDWGGVFTVGTFDGRAITRLARLYGVPEADLRPRYLELMELFEVGAFDLPAFTERLSRAVGRDADEGAFREAFLDAPLERPATYALLAGIPDGYAVGMLSNNVPVLCDRVREDPRAARIERFVFSNEIGARKPDPVAFMALAEGMRLAPHEIVFVDDAAANVEAARALGFRALLLDSPDAFATRWRAALPALAHLVDGPGWGAEAP